MNIAIITSIKAPYRSLQIEEICKNKEISMTVYYTKKGKEDRDWESKDSTKFKEVFLEEINFFDRFGTLNKGLIEIVKSNEIIVLGGYEKPTYMLLSILCRLYKKKYIIIYDGISCNRLTEKEHVLKKHVKNLMIKYSSAIWGNGVVSKRYFSEVFNYPKEKIYNQYLTIDGKKIKQLGNEKNRIKQELRQKYSIGNNEKILLYSGRLIELKNIESVIKALSLSQDRDITLVIAGGGKEEKKLVKMAKELGVKIIITGFINNQELLFKHYFMADVFILPSKSEAWGLVVNEAMFAGLPILVSNICGCSLDLVKAGVNGYLIDPYDIKDIYNKIYDIFYKDNISEFGYESKRIIDNWTFINSRINFELMIKSIIN